MKSMTGFGSAQFSSDAFDLDVSVKCINGRFLEAKLSLPHEYAPFEGEIKRHVQKYFERGTMTIYVGRRPGPSSRSAAVTVQTERARKWIKAYRDLGSSLGLNGAPDLDIVARLPEVIKFHESAEISPREKKIFFQTLDRALKACDSERQREGIFLAKELLRLMKLLQKQIQRVAEFRAGANAAMREMFQARLKKLNYQPQFSEERLNQEVVLLIEKSDITEEIQRLSEHLDIYKGLVTGREAQGKKLDFYIQELLREINTIGSKSPTSKMTEAVVESKSLIEKMREQVQNIE